MSDWQDVPDSEWQDVPSDSTEPPSWLDALSASLQKGVGNIAEGIGGGIKAVEDATTGTGLGQYLLDIEDQYQKPREDLLSRIPSGSAKKYLSGGVEGITSATPMLLSGGVFPAVGIAGALGFGRQYDRAKDLGADGWDAAKSALTEGATEGALAVPVFTAAQAAGPLLKRALVSGAVSAGSAIPGTLGQAYADMLATDKPMDPYDVGQNTREAMITSGLTGLAMPLLTGAQKRVQSSNELPGFTTPDEMLARMQADATVEAPPPAEPLALDYQQRQLLDYQPQPPDPLNYKQGDGFQFRDYSALPPLDISQPQQALSSVPPEPLNWQYNQLDPSGLKLQNEQPLLLDYEAPKSPLSSIPPEPLNWQYRGLDAAPETTFIPEQPLQIGFDGYPQSKVPDWELSPNYKRGDDFQYRDFAALPPALTDPQAKPVEKEVATKVTDAKPPVDENPVQKVDDSESFPNITKAPEKPTAPAKPETPEDNSPQYSQPTLFPSDSVQAKTPDQARAKTAQRIANKRRRPVKESEIYGPKINSESGFGATWLIDLFRKNPDALPDYKDQSESNKRYAKFWPKYIEWMDTTRKKSPEAAPFIDAYWKAPQDLNAITYDAKLTLDPYLGLSAEERAPVDSYLAAARVMGSRDPKYKITPQTAANVGLNPKQIDAALSVSKWSGEMLNLLEDHAVAVAEHAASKKGQQVSPEKLNEIKTQFAELRDSNYVPFNRYGEHYINVFDKDGNLAYRYQFERKSDPELAKTVRHFNQLVKQNGTDVFGGKVEYGRASPAKLNEYDGVPSDILDILNDGSASGEVRGFNKHLKPAALVKGFNPDMLRNISEYTTGAAKLVSLQRAKMAGEKALVALSPGGLRGPDNINLVRKLQSWADGFNQPQSPIFRSLNNAFNVAYIGGNLRTPTADMLGRIQLQYPLMSKYLKGLQPEATFAKGIGKEIKWWFSSDSSFAKSNPDLSAGIREAQRKGVIPTGIYKTFVRNARGESSGALAFKNKVHDLYFGLKEISERSTDLGGFILGWEMYPEYMKGKGAGKDIRTRQQFAEDFVRESKAVPSQGELPAAFKSNTARLVTKYRLYQAKILKSLSQAGFGQWARYLGATGFTTGIAGLPFLGRDAFNAARAAGVEPEDKLRELGAGSATMYGPMSALAGIDFSGSAGFGEIFPGAGSNVLTKFMTGIAGAPADQMTRMYNYYQRGQSSKALAAAPFMPNAVSNFLTQQDWGNRGITTLGGQALIPRDEVQAVDRIKKLLGYQPLRVKEAMVAENRKKQAIAGSRDNEFINQKIGEALGLGDQKTADELKAYAREKGLKINPNSINDYRLKIQGKDTRIPARARAEVKRLKGLYD